MDLKLTGKRALVCGSTAGIGKAIAIALSNEGVSVTLMARDKDKLTKVKGVLSAKEQQDHHIIVADFNDPETVKNEIKEYCQSNQIDILINNTGGPKPNPIHESLASDFLQAFQQHLICNQHLVQAVLPGMKTAGYGRVINIISTSVKQPIANLGVSNTVRGAVASWSKTLSKELGGFGITVNNVLPGFTMTGRLESIIQKKSKDSGKSLEEVSAEMHTQIPAGRFAEPHETADAVVFLASPKASYINGVNLPVDGGRLDCF
ncbi:SDR family oxidoreductase [Marivirga sp. S37H4]|uniref:SDR family oxidoreductase n=1 Tax=Marivirga aurantiaca TaxID=2802615 RepID=A0A934X1I7_9BACT|nr:SDR family oxidoreductase [Marivirga aurantiaca]MBK6266611.1 SDR family oxidoreductase [Marivirga aurantiaca]